MKTLHRNHGSSLWMERPLSSELLSYAANDIRGIAALHKFFDQAGWLSSATMRDILSQSARYLAIHDTRGPVDPTDIFRKGPFLPLDILSSPKGATQICEACLRRISSRHFDTVGKKGKRKSSCRVCEAMKLKIKFDKKKAEAKEKKVAEREAKAASQQPAVIGKQSK
jgi:exonuclease 3'-5' domain-containing protein 1